MKINMISGIIDLDRVAYSVFFFLFAAYLNYLFLKILPHKFG